MSSIIRIRRRTSPGSAGAPSSLYQAEIAFNEVDKVLYYGFGNGGGSPATAASIIAIGGEGQYVTLGTNQTITGNKTFSGTLTGTLTGSATSVSNSLTIGGGLSQNGATFNGSSAQTVSLPFIGTSGTYGSATSIPVITTDVYGRVTGVSTSTISSTINLSGNSGTGSVVTGGTHAVAGGSGIITTAAGAGITVAIDTNIVATLTGAQVLTNKQIDTGAGNTVKIAGTQLTSTTGTGATVVLATSPTIYSPSLSNTVLSGTLNAGGSNGSSNQYLQSTGSGVAWGTFANLSIGAGLSQNGSNYNTLSAQSISLPVVLSNPGSFGSATSIPVISVDGFGRITSASTTSISTTINLTGNSGTGSVAGGGTLAVAGGTGIISSIAGSGVTVAIDTNIVATLTGAQVLTNKQIDTGAGNTFKIAGTQLTSTTGTGATVVLATSPTVYSPSLSNAVLNGTLNAGGSNGSSNQYLQSTGSGVAWGTFANLTIGAGLSQNGSNYNTVSSQTISLPVVLSNPGSFGSATSIPIISIDSFGRITSASTSSISTTINLTGNSGTGSVAGGGTHAVAGGSGIITTAAGAGITVAIDTNIVATLTGAQVLTNKQIDTGAGNTVKFGGVQVLGVTGSGTSVVLATSPSLITPNIGVATATSVTASSGNLVLAAASGNNNVTLTPTGSGVVDVGGFIVRNVQTPILPNDAVNKSYADAIASSLNVHDSVAAATWSPVSYAYVGGGTSQTITTISSNLVTFSANHGLNTNDQVRSNNTTNGFTTGTTYYVLTVPGLNQLTLASVPGGATKTLTDGSGLSISTTTNQGVGAQLTGTGQTVDQYNVQANDRILVLNHTTNAYNGVYVVTTVGTGSNGVWTRATDYDNSPTGEILPGDFIFVGGGTTYAKSGWAQTNNGPIIVGTSSIQFTQFSGAGTYTPGTGISIVGNNIALSNTTLTVTAGTGLTGGGAVALGQAITLNNAGVLTVAGTSNQVLVNGTTGTGTSGAITLGLPQAIATGSGVTFGALLVTGNILSSGTGTSLGTIVNTVWNGSTVTVPYGGTGVTTFTTKGVLYGNAGSAIQVTPTAGTGDSNTSNQILTVDGNGVPVWSSYIDGGTFIWFIGLAGLIMELLKGTSV